MSTSCTRPTLDFLNIEAALRQYQRACQERRIAEEELERRVEEGPAEAGLAEYFESARRHEAQTRRLQETLAAYAPLHPGLMLALLEAQA